MNETIFKYLRKIMEDREDIKTIDVSFSAEGAIDRVTIRESDDSNTLCIIKNIIITPDEWNCEERFLLEKESELYYGYRIDIPYVSFRDDVYIDPKNISYNGKTNMIKVSDGYVVLYMNSDDVRTLVESGNILSIQIIVTKSE